MWDNPRRSGLWCEVGPIRGTAPKQQRLVTLKQQYRKATNVLKKGGADPETGGESASRPRARGEHLPKDGSRGLLSYAARRVRAPSVRAPTVPTATAK